MPDFSLNDWVDYWIYEFNPIVPELEGSWGYAAVPLWDKLHDWIEELEEQAQDPKEGQRTKKLLDQALGPTWGLVKMGHIGYLTLSICKEFHISASEWANLSLREKGKYIAHMQLQGAVQTYERLISTLKRG